jgi:predicted metal-dependent enzyme (double-stranded beta helix superfamily)
MPEPTLAPAQLARIARRLADQPSLWRPQIRYDEQTRYYTRLLDAPDHEVWLLTWLPGQGTTWHDHGGSAGAFATVQGTLTERHAVPGDGGTARPVPTPRRLTGGAVRPFGRRHVHQVTNDGLVPAVSVHVYAPSLSEMTEYERRGELLYSLRTQLAGVNW